MATTLNRSDYLLLALLSKSVCSGYELKRIMSKNSTFYGGDSNAQIYPVLKQLEKKGLVTSKIDESSGKRQKRSFYITEKGLSSLFDWLNTSNNDVFIYREDFLIKVSLAQHLEKKALQKMIQEYQSSVEKKLVELEKMQEHVQTDHAKKADQSYLLLIYDHFKTVLEAKRNWCEKVLKST